ncbi:MAG TPA: biotin--[acetyl-CoA-carboxylase] ligase [Thermoleophilaceae bacterium]|nr:biotin--[acetyl-CoA-carboxylase] ligase [Thermoleophilaceae bacterium]
MIGTPRVHHRLTDSTNERAKALAADGAPHGTLVTADEQSAGRGRQGRVWTAPPGSAVLMSLVLRELDERHALLPLAAAVAVCEAMPVEASVKWPNDIWIERRKVAGILVEARPQAGWAVLGIGLNVSITHDDFPPELRDTATSLSLASAPPGPPATPAAPATPATPATPASVLGLLLPALDHWLGASPVTVLSAWRDRDALKGEPIAWSDGSGIADGIDDSGALLVQTRNGPVTLDAGEVHLQR